MPMQQHCNAMKIIATKNFSADLILKQLPQLSATADGMMLQHMPRPTQCWEAVLILQLYMCANAPAL